MELAGMKARTLHNTLKILARPIVEFCLRNSLRIQDLEQCFRQVLVEAAREEIERKGGKVTDSRLSIMTGLHRREITRLVKSDPVSETNGNLITKIVGHWQTDKRFCLKSGRGRTLSLDREGGEFYKLVRSISSDLNPATVLFELERTGAVERTEQGVRLVEKEYIRRGDLEGGFRVVGADIGDLIGAAECNLLEKRDIPQLHLRTEYDRVREDAIPRIQKWILNEGHALHQRARAFISRFDQDVNPQLKYSGRFQKVVLGSFGRVGNHPDNDGTE